MLQLAFADDTAILTVVGELDLPETPGLHDALSRSVVPIGTPFVVDLTKCTFILSVAVGELIRAHQERGETFRMRVAPNGPVERVLKIVGLSSFTA